MSTIAPAPPGTADGTLDPMNPSDYRSAAEIAEYLRTLGVACERDTLRHWHDRHADFPRGIKVGQAWVWPVAGVERWVRKTGRIPTPD